MQHLVYLRKMILSRANTRIDFTSHQMKVVRLYCSEDGFVGEKAVITAKLKLFLQATDGKAYKINSPDPFASHPTFSASLCITDALKQMQIDNGLAQRLVIFCKRLPNVSVKLISLHRAGFGDFLQDYMSMHSASLRNGHLNIGTWINEAPDDGARHKRLQLFVIVFCLGIIAPKLAVPTASIKNASVISEDLSSKQSILNRIIRRVREI